MFRGYVPVIFEQAERCAGIIEAQMPFRVKREIYGLNEWESLVVESA